MGEAITTHSRAFLPLICSLHPLIIFVAAAPNIFDNLFTTLNLLRTTAPIQEHITVDKCSGAVAQLWTIVIRLLLAFTRSAFRQRSNLRSEKAVIDRETNALGFAIKLTARSTHSPT